MRTGGIRPRLTLLTTLSVLAAMTLGILAVVLVLHRSLQYSLVDRTRTQASTVATLVAGQGPAALRAGNSRGLIDGAEVQVRDEAGRLVFSSGSMTPVSASRPAPGRFVVAGTRSLPTFDEDDHPLVVATAATGARGTYTVYVARSTLAQHEAVVSLARIMLVGLPMLLAFTAIVAWWLVGTSLRPVEAIRRKTADITSGNLNERVPVPVPHDEVYALAVTMNAMLERLDASARAQNRFVADASHELRSPLTTLRGAAQLGRRHGAREWHELLPLVETESERLDRLVDDLLMLSKTQDRGSVPMDVQDVDLDDLLSIEARRLRTATGRRVTASVTPVRITGDPQLLGQVLRNLGENAARAARSRVDLHAELDGDVAVLTVSDDGAGIPPADRDRVFDRFVRLDEARSRDAGGSGLGLAIVAEIVHAHGGTVEVTTSPALGGAAFVVTLPTG